MVVTSKQFIHIPQSKTLYTILKESFKKRQDRIAMMDGATGNCYKYSELNDVINTIAGNLYHVTRVRKGDVICVSLPNCLEHALLLLAIPQIGAIYAPCNPAYTKYELTRHLQDAGVDYFITNSENCKLIPELLQARPQLREVYIVGENTSPCCIPFSELLKESPLPPQIDIKVKEDVAAVLFSSGTTGLPKGVMLTHFNITAGVFIYREGKVYRDGKETTVSVFPLYHVAGVYNLYTGLLQGLTYICYQQFDFENFLAANAKYKATIILVPPPILVALAKLPVVSKYDLSSVDVIATGAAPSSKGIHTEIMQRLPFVKEIRQGYGMTEYGTISIQLSGETEIPSCGTVYPNTQIKVVDIETGEELPDGKDGEICVRGPTVMKGYLKDPTATANTIKNGWLHTGDIGHIGEANNLFITDRLKELIKFKAFQVAPAELEALVLTHPAVADVAIIGVPDLHAGELPRAYVALKPGHTATEDDIKNYVKERVAPYKQLRGGLEFIDEIPKSPSGKLLRRQLKDKFIAKSLPSKM